MTVEIGIVFALLVAAVVLFATEWVSFDVAALLVLCALLVTGIVSPEQGLSGLSNHATVTIAALFVIAEGVRRTGALNDLGDAFARLVIRRRRAGLAGMLVAVAIVSAFVNNTAAVAIFIPVVLDMSRQVGVSPSKLLMPLSYASMFGGTCTLLGTSTNVLVSSIARVYGQAPFGMFELAPLGLVLLASGFVYLLTLGIRWIPARREVADFADGFAVKDYLTDVVVEPGHAHLGEPLNEAPLTEGLDLDVVQVFKRSDGLGLRAVARGGAGEVLEAGDVLRVRGSVEDIDRLVERQDLTLLAHGEWTEADVVGGLDALVEAVIAPDSLLEGAPIRRVRFQDRFGAVLVALRHHGELRQEQLGSTRLAAGDSVLLALPSDRVQDLAGDRSFVLVSEVGLPRYRRERLPLALAILAGVVAAATAGLAPVVTAAVTGAVVMVLTGCLSSEEAYQAINWKIILLLAGVIPLGVAMEETGAAGLLAQGVLTAVGPWGPVAVLSGFFLLTLLLTEVISNPAAAALLAPIAIQAAHALGASPRPFLMAVAFAASLSFMTPVGYQTNTLVYGPGQYRFTDFTRVGAPLNLLFWLLCTFLIPVFWPLEPGG